MEALQADLDRANSAFARSRSAVAWWRTGALAGLTGLAGALLLPLAGVNSWTGAGIGLALGGAGGVVWGLADSAPLGKSR